MPLYATFSQLYEPGTVLQPGVYGQRICSFPAIRSINERGNPVTAPEHGWYVAQEAILETARVIVDGRLPPRLIASFAFEREEDARTYAKHHGRQHIYEVAFEAALPTHRAGFNLVSWPDVGVPYYPWMLQRAIAYWRGEQITIPELLSFSPLRIIAQLPPAAPAAAQGGV